MNKTIKTFAAIALLATGFFASQAFSQSQSQNAIKPQGGTVLSDEQQGILAVRTIKTSVVDIIGVPKNNPPAQASSSQSIIISVPEGVSGTGFVYDASGLIVTNDHVVDDTSLDYTVILPDGSQYPATILGHDKYDDVALLKISASGLVPARLGDSAALETGQTVFAIGNSLGRYEDSVTRGVVSGLERYVQEPTGTDRPAMHNWIQTDAAINLGNSGGPLIDLAGEVIGMNTLIDTQGSSLGFAVPINTVKDAISQLQTFGQVSRPFLGVSFQTITPQVKQSQHLSLDNGAYIAKVLDGGPAATAGLQAGDIVLGVNGQDLSQTTELDEAVQAYTAGSQVMLKVWRNGQTLELPVILGRQQ
ncbi:MAG TPA: trypsin-like peptidase domain-containing protein [Patescibacteria group bacterium]|nr:trypsin-like peptidase domain-containing protein [Patescibacteria group bacterium]